MSAATAAAHGISGVIVQVRRWRGTVLLYAAVDALAAGEPLDDVLVQLGAIVEHDVPGAVVLVAAGWDGHRFDVVAPAPGTAPAHRRLATDIAELPADAWCREEGEPCGDAVLVEGSGLVSCWPIPVTVRGDVRPTAAVFLFGSSPIAPSSHSTTVERVATLVALAIESDRNRLAWRRSAVTDRLTDLPNRTGLEEWLRSRSSERRTTDIAVLFWGGDEFVVVCTDPSSAEALASRLITHLREPVGLGDHRAEVGLSIGITYGTTRAPLDDLLRESDRALLQAKAAGRNRYVVRS